MRIAEANAAPAFGTIAAPGGQFFRLGARFHHGFHDAHGASIKNGRNQMIVMTCDAHQGNYANIARKGALGLDRINPHAAMFHIKNHVFSTGIRQDLTKPRC